MVTDDRLNIYLYVMNKTKIPIYSAQIGALDDTGIYAISFVDFPANGQNFVALNKHQQIKLNLNKQKQILTGVVLIPDQLIYRRDAKLGEYYIKFSAGDIEKIALKMMRTGLALQNTTHQHESELKGNYLTELWIVQDPKRDKSVALGLGEYPKGTLLASYKVESSEYWRKEVLTGNVKGFSLEGFFNFNNLVMNKKTAPAAKLAAKKKPSTMGTFLRTMAAMLEGETVADAEAIVDVAADDEVDAGDPYLIFELADGGEVWVDAEGFATLDGEQMPAGEHALADGNFIVIDDAGNLVVTQEEADGAEAEVPEVALRKAKARGEAVLMAMNGKTDPKAAKIANLEKQLAALKKAPSTPKAKAPVDGAGKGAPTTFNEKMAAVLKNRLDRKNGK